MKVGLISDCVNFPSIPVMKLSAFHKKLGDDVELVTNNFESYDICYISKVFNLDLPTIPNLLYRPQADKYIEGGSGYCIEIINNKEVYNKEKDKPLSEEIEHIYPDYELYPQYKNTAYGFLTRGCPNNCPFCVVSKKEGLCSHKVANLSEFWNGQKEIKLCDPNILACKDREDLLKQLVESKAIIDYTQGLDARLIDDDIAKLICQTKIKMIHFAFDLMKNEERILNGLKIFSKYCNKGEREKKVYILTNFDSTLQQDWYRVKRVKELGYTPYVMIYQKGTHPQFLTDLQRWANSMYLQRSVSFEEYIPRKDNKSCKDLYKKIILR